MTGKAKRDGDQFEREVAAVLEFAGIDTWRPRAGYPDDIGDVLLPGQHVILQAKWTQNRLVESVNSAMADLPTQLDNAIEDQNWPLEASFGAAVIKRRQKSTAQALVCMTLGDFARLLTRDS